jgi:hypothetical protein
MIEVDGEWLSMSENGTVIEVKEIKANGEYKYDSIADLYDIIKGDTLIEVFMNEDDDIDLIVIIPDGKDLRPEVTPVVKTELNKAIAAAVVVDETLYTDASYAVVEAALAAAQTVAADKDATQAEVNTATTALNNAVAALVVKTPIGEVTAEATLVGDLLGVKSYAITVEGAELADVDQVLVNGASKTNEIIGAAIRVNVTGTLETLAIVIDGVTIPVVIK